MQGTVLRTNYRRTGGTLDILAFGGGYTSASAQSGVGTNLPYGGFVYIKSYALCVSNLTGNAVAESTHGVMSFYYGSAKFPDGYRFLPLNILVRSGISNLSDGASAWNGASLPVIWAPTWSTSALSIWIVNCFGFSDSLLATLSNMAFLADVWGFIISSP